MFPVAKIYTSFVLNDLPPIFAGGFDWRKARDAMSSKCVLAHEYFGHYMHRKTKLKAHDWRDEFRASYSAARKAKGLSIE